MKDDLHVVAGSPEGFVAAVTNAMPALARLGKGVLTLSGDKANVTGEARDPKTAEGGEVVRWRKATRSARSISTSAVRMAQGEPNGEPDRCPHGHPPGAASR